MRTFGHQFNTVITQLLRFQQKIVNGQCRLSAPNPCIADRMQTGFEFEILGITGGNFLRLSGDGQLRKGKNQPQANMHNRSHFKLLCGSGDRVIG